MSCKISSGSSKLVESLVAFEHLRESNMFIRPAPRALDCGNMLGFRDPGTKTVRGAKVLDVVVVMDHGVLSGE